MAVSMEIRENGQVAYYVLTDPWETNNLTDLYPQDIRYRDSVNCVVHTFMNVGGVQHVPSNIIRARLGAPAFIHPNSGQLVMVGAKIFPKTVAETIFRIAHYERARFFDTEEEGWHYIRQFLQGETVSVH
jgi:hypothetical protein